MSIKQMRLDVRRIESLLAAREKAQDPEFKDLWNQKLEELLDLIKSRPNSVIQ